MVFRRRKAIETPGVPPGFQGRQRVLAAVVHAALKRAGYDACFLGGVERPGLSIGAKTTATDAISIGNLSSPASFTHRDAQVCAARLNTELRTAVPSASGLAVPTQSTTTIGRVPYAEVVVRCPNDATLRALHNKLVR